MNEFKHLSMLSQKYNIGAMTIGVFWGLAVLSNYSLIRFENWLKGYIEHRKMGRAVDYLECFINDTRINVTDRPKIDDDIYTAYKEYQTNNHG